MLSTGKRGPLSNDRPEGRSGARPNWRSAAERYEVLNRAGEGTLFAVYRVRDRETNQTAALKALKNAFVKHPRLSSELQRIAAQIPTLDHPSLVPILDSGAAEGTFYIVTDWLQGQQLEQRIRVSPLGTEEILAIVRQVANALFYLQEIGVPHGDLRPRQIWLGADAQVQITDTGIGIALHTAGIVPFDVQQDTAYFMAPERFDGAPPSLAADFYALGVILYLMLTGRVPFDGTAPLMIGARHRVDRPLRPSQFNPDCDAQLESIALRLLDKSPQARMEAAHRLLRPLTNTTRRPAPPDVTPLTASNDLRPPTPPTPPAPPRAAASQFELPIAVVPVEPEEQAPAATVAYEAEEEEVPRPRRRARRPEQAPGVESGSDSPAAEVAIDSRLAKRQHRRKEFWGMMLALFWLIMLLGMMGGGARLAYDTWLSNIPPEIKVPQYVGLSKNEAEAILQQAGLRPKVESLKSDEKLPEDTVISGDVPPGKLVRQGREIGLVISKGAEPIRMYDFSELAIGAARAIIRRDGMRLGQVTEQYHDNIPDGYVCGQYPAPGDPLRRTDPINLYVSKGVPPTDSDIETDPLPAPPELTPEEMPPPIEGTPATDVPVVSRVVTVRVALPKGSSSQEVKIIVDDAIGERTVYRRTHKPGDLVDEFVRVQREQGATASIRIFLGGKLFKEERV